NNDLCTHNKGVCTHSKDVCTDRVCRNTHRAGGGSRTDHRRPVPLPNHGGFSPSLYATPDGSPSLYAGPDVLFLPYDRPPSQVFLQLQDFLLEARLKLVLSNSSCYAPLPTTLSAAKRATSVPSGIGM